MIELLAPLKSEMRGAVESVKTPVLNDDFAAHLMMAVGYVPGREPVTDSVQQHALANALQPDSELVLLIPLRQVPSHPGVRQLFGQGSPAPNGEDAISLPLTSEPSALAHQCPIDQAEVQVPMGDDPWADQQQAGFSVRGLISSSGFVDSAPVVHGGLLGPADEDKQRPMTEVATGGLSAEIAPSEGELVASTAKPLGFEAPSVTRAQRQPLADVARISDPVLAPAVREVYPLGGAGSEPLLRTEEGLLPFRQPDLAADVETVQVQFSPIGVATSSAQEQVPPVTPSTSETGSQVQTVVLAEAVNAVRVASSSGRDTLVVQLHPPELGNISLRLVRTAEGITAHFVASSPSTRVLLAEQMSALLDTLAQQGLHLEGAGVFAGGGEGKPQKHFRANTPSERRRSGSQQVPNHQILLSGAMKLDLQV